MLTVTLVTDKLPATRAPASGSSGRGFPRAGTGSVRLRAGDQRRRTRSSCSNATGRRPGVIAGGHSLLPMMKLRLARPEWLIDINDLGRARPHHRGRRRAADRRADPARRPARLRARRPAVPDRPRRRAGHRRPRRAQPRHDRRLARPGRPGRGPHHGLRRPPRRRSSSPARGGERVVGMAEFHRGPYETAVRAARAAHRDPLPDPRRARAAPTRRSSAGSGDWAVAAAGAALWMAEDGTIADAAHRAHRPRARGPRHRARRACSSASGPARTSSPRPADLARAASAPIEDQRGPVDYKRHLAERAHPARPAPGLDRAAHPTAVQGG